MRYWQNFPLKPSMQSPMPDLAPDELRIWTACLVVGLGVAALWLHRSFARLRAQRAAIDNSQLILQNRLDSVLLAVFTTNREGVIKSANLTALRWLEQDPQTLIGSFFHQIVVGANWDADADVLDKDPSLTDMDRSVEAGLRLPDGTTRPVLLTRSSLSEDFHADHRFMYAATDVTALQQAEQKIYRLSNFELVTGLPNRLLLGAQFRQLTASPQTDVSIVFCWIELQRLMPIAKLRGTTVRDEILRSATARLQDAFGSQLTLGCIDGQHFLGLLCQDSRSASADASAALLLECLKPPVLVGNVQYDLGAIVGVSHWPSDGTDFDTLRGHAALAALRAAASGGRRYARYRAEDESGNLRRQQLEMDLASGFSRQEFELHYQPLVALADSRVHGFEALLRWRHPTLGLLLPGEFLRLIEDAGYSEVLLRWVLDQACRWRTQIGALWPGPVAVNISALQLQLPDFESTVLAALSATGLAPHGLELELTEESFTPATPALIAALRRLRGRGVTLALDDFGCGYSNLAALRSYPLDRIKIDRSFIAPLPGSAADLAAFRAIVELSRAFHLPVIVEGIESAAQAAIARREGCQWGQGYLWLAPGNCLAALSQDADAA
jgi:PAS domain S-box-containing protein